MSDIEGKAARVAASKRGQRASFKSLLILMSRGDMWTNSQLSTINSQPSTALYERRIKHAQRFGARHRAIDRVK